MVPCCEMEIGGCGIPGGFYCTPSVCTPYFAFTLFNAQGDLWSGCRVSGIEKLVREPDERSGKFSQRAGKEKHSRRMECRG